MRGETFGLDRVRGWAASHTTAADAAWALLWTVAGLATLPTGLITGGREPVWFAITLVIGVALAFRRSHPRACIAVIGLALVAHVLALHAYTISAAIGALGATYTAHAQLPRRDRVLATTAVFAGTAWAAVDYGSDVLTLQVAQRWPVILFQWVLVAFFALLGASARNRREVLTRALEHAATLERQQAQEIRLATLDERTRIAREMHDIVAHSLGVIVAQADGGRYATAADPAAGMRALETIAQVGRGSLAEMRALLTVLRSDDVREFLPAPALADLDALTQEYRQAGLDVAVRTTGEAVSVPGTLALTVYRLVQESLANALRHAGRVRVQAELAWAPGVLTIDIRNRLPEPGAAPTPTKATPGHGLVGMRERVMLHGGTLTAGPQDGVWRVRAELPLPAASTPPKEQPAGPTALPTPPASPEAAAQPVPVDPTPSARSVDPIPGGTA